MDHRISCTEMLRRLDDYVDRNLTPEEISLVEEHLTECLVCARQYRFEIAVVNGIRERLQRIALPPDLLSAIHRRLEAESAGQ
ncbi:MAG: anti-sigma factor family protein [Gemmatimonadales bacterium]